MMVFWEARLHSLSKSGFELYFDQTKDELHVFQKEMILYHVVHSLHAREREIKRGEV